MNINQFVYDTFNIKQEELPKFLLLFSHSFFLGLFIAFYFVPANATFIQHFDSKQLPIAYIFAGFAGYLSSSLYSALQKRISNQSLFLGALFFMLIITLASRLALGIVNAKYLSFFVFVWVWPFISLVGIETGGLAIRLLNLRQVKRLYGLINMGGVIASILGYLVIPLLLKIFSHAYDLLIVGAFGIVISIIILLYIFKKFAEKKEDKYVESRLNENKTQFRTLFKERYFKLIFISATLSMTVIYLADFGFLASIKIQNTLLNTPEKVSSFMAFVFAGLKVGELILSYLSGRILSRYGVRLGLTILPTTSLALILLASVVGLLIGANSIMFLAIMVLNKSLERILRRGLDDPSFNVLYQTIDVRQQLAIQSKVGVVMQLSIGLAGGILLFFNRALTINDVFHLELFPLFFLPVLIAWLIFAGQLYKAYRDKIRDILTDLSKKKKREHKFAYSLEILLSKFRFKNTDVVKMAVTVLAETNPKVIEKQAVPLLNKENPTITRAILRNIDPSWSLTIMNKVSDLYYSGEAEDLGVEKIALQAIKHLDYTKSFSLNRTEIENFLNQNSENAELIIVKYLMNNKSAKDEDIIIKLLDSQSVAVKRAAISLAFKRQTKILNKKLVAKFASEKCYQFLANYLITIGLPIIKDLDEYFVKETEVPILKKIIEIYAKINQPQSHLLLVSHINYPNSEIQYAVIKSLNYCQYQAPATEAILVKKKLEEVVENILWLYLCINDIESQKNTLKLNQALELEKEKAFDKLFNLLSFLHKPAIIDLIKKNIIGENIIFALEIIDNFINQDIKQLIIPLIDKMSINQRIKKLSPYTQQTKLQFDERLKNIVMKGFQSVDVWTKSKAIELLGRHHKISQTLDKLTDDASSHYKNLELWTENDANDLLQRIKRSDMPDEIFLSMHHTDELVYSTAAKVIYDENPSRCFDYLRKLPQEKHELIEILSNPDYPKKIITERVKLLKRVFLFFSIPENTLIKLAGILRTKDLSKNEALKFFHNNQDEDIFIIIKGQLVEVNSKAEKNIFERNAIIIRGLNIDEDCIEVLAEKKTSVIIFNRNQYFNLLAEDTEILQYIFDRLQTNVE